MLAIVVSTAFEAAGRHNPVGSAIVGVATPVITLVRAVVDGVASLGYIFRLKPIAADNERLENENALLKKRVAELEAAEAEASRLRKLLKLPELARYKFVSARVIGRSLELWFDSIWIDRGTRDGIAQGDLVLAAGGLAGEIETADRDKSKVRLLFNPDFAIGAVTSVSGSQGVVKSGVRERIELVNTLRLDFVPKRNKISVGEKVYTSGLTQGKPRGVYIGTVGKVISEANKQTQTIEVEPGADLGSLEEVAVLATGGTGGHVGP